MATGMFTNPKKHHCTDECPFPCPCREEKEEGDYE
jgi:hypothetical protein